MLVSLYSVALSYHLSKTTHTGPAENFVHFEVVLFIHVEKEVWDLMAQRLSSA